LQHSCRILLDGWVLTVESVFLLFSPLQSSAKVRQPGCQEQKQASNGPSERAVGGRTRPSATFFQKNRSAKKDFRQQKAHALIKKIRNKCLFLSLLSSFWLKNA
jgi:hypothetical protein